MRSQVIHSCLFLFQSLDNAKSNGMEHKKFAGFAGFADFMIAMLRRQFITCFADATCTCKMKRNNGLKSRRLVVIEPVHRFIGFAFEERCGLKERTLLQYPSEPYNASPGGLLLQMEENY